MFSIVIGTLFIIIFSFVFGSFYVIVDKTISVKRHDQTCTKMKWHHVNIAFITMTLNLMLWEYCIHEKMKKIKYIYWALHKKIG
jgi:hypothetical protein